MGRSSFVPFPIHLGERNDPQSILVVIPATAMTGIMILGAVSGTTAHRQFARVESFRAPGEVIAAHGMSRLLARNHRMKTDESAWAKLNFLSLALISPSWKLLQILGQGAAGLLTYIGHITSDYS